MISKDKEVDKLGKWLTIHHPVLRAT